MSAASDLGARDGFGAVAPEANESVFHADWERRVLALTLAMGATGMWNVDMSRWARENRPSGEYLQMSYYELWLAGLQRLLVEHDLVTPAELESGDASSPARPLNRRPSAADIAGVLRRGAPSTEREVATSAKFSVGQIVITSDFDPSHHTRLPNYARSKRGRIAVVHGCHVFPDMNAQGLGEQPVRLYTVEFSAVELFGDDVDPRATISVDAFEPYLDSV
jgi:nitrile hydratase beta subunit